MRELNIKGTPDSPTVSFDEINNYLLIEGRSILEDPAKFYKPLISKLEDFEKSNSRKMEIDFKLEYFNTASSRYILDILKRLRAIDTPNNEVTINWFYDEVDEDILEIGQDFGSIIKFPINLMINPN